MITPMPMHALRTNARIIALSTAVVALGAWNLVGFGAAEPGGSAPEPGSPMMEPALVPELVGAHGGAAGADPAKKQAAPQPQGDSQGAVPGTTQLIAERVFEAIAPDAAYHRLLDTVFGPDRFVADPSAASIASAAVDGGQAEGGPADGVGSRTGRGGWLPSAARSPVESPTAAAAATSEVSRAPDTERAFYESYLAMAKADAQELARQADAVLRGGVEPYQQVAMLRALYDTDRSQAIDRFVQAIANLPDVSRPEGVSVPTFAVSYLGQHIGDPAVKGLLERMAWSGYLNLAPPLRNQAALAVLRVATDADRQRYTGYPAYQEWVATQAAAGGNGQP